MDIPLEIDGNETVVRNIFYPQHLRKDGRLKWQAYRPDKNGEVSVLRLEHCGESFCFEYGRIQSNENRKFHGFIKLVVKQILSASNKISIVASPLKDQHNNIDLPFHADIVFDHKPVPGEPLPEEYITICRRLAEIGSKLINANKC